MIGNDRTWVYFQEWWQEVYSLKDETDITTSSLEFDINLQTEDDAVYDTSV